jgi:DNA (cytosine-5)-methyltransferase 1
MYTKSFMKIAILAEKLSQEGDSEIFCGYIDNGRWLSHENPFLSRSHRQPNRIYSANGIHPTLSSSETQGRYYVCEIIFDSSNEGKESR